jgi:hypothetical protein
VADFAGHSSIDNAKPKSTFVGSIFFFFTFPFGFGGSGVSVEGICVSFRFFIFYFFTLCSTDAIFQGRENKRVAWLSAYNHGERKKRPAKAIPPVGIEPQVLYSS